MTLPLPYVLGTDDDPIQGNFDQLKKQFPLSRKHMKIETPKNIGDAGQPAFQGTWVNEDPSTLTRARYWKDPMGLVHVEGTIQSGTINTTAFTLPEGYRPGVGTPPLPAATNTGYGEIRIAPTGEVLPVSGGTGYFGFSVHFKQEN
jgi:hypothetical protein